MQSTAMVALRTTIMIVCLVAVPLAAVMGTALPRFLASLLDGRAKTTTAGPSTPSAVGHPTLAVNEPVSAGHEEATPALPSDEVSAAEHPTAHITAVRPAADPPPAARADARTPEERLPVAAVTGVRTAAAPPALEETSPFWSARRPPAASSRPRYSTAHYESRDAEGQAEPGMAPSGGRRADRLKQGLHQATLLKTGYSLSAEAAQQPADRPLVKVDHPAIRPDADARASDPLATSEHRLRELGATYYRLEPWGDHGEFFRCACDVRLGPRSRAARHFEAIEPTASQAVAAVIEQVERHTRRAGRE